MLSLELLSQMSHWGFPFLCLGLLAEMWQHSWSHNYAYCLRFFSRFAAFYEYSAYGFPLQGAVLFPNFSRVNTGYFWRQDFSLPPPALHLWLFLSLVPFTGWIWCTRAKSSEAVVDLDPASCGMQSPMLTLCVTNTLWYRCKLTSCLWLFLRYLKVVIFVLELVCQIVKEGLACSSCLPCSNISADLL